MNVVRELEYVEKNGENPTVECVIEDCGEIQPGQDDGVEVDTSGDVYAHFPGDSDIDFTNKDNLAKVLEIAGEVRKLGNNLFKEKLYDKAKKKYNKALRYIDKAKEDMELNDDEEEKISKSEALSVNLNLAACNLHLEQYEAALDNCDDALEIDESNCKALFRRGQAQNGLKKWEEALECFQKALEIEPNDKGIKRELEKVKKLQQEYKNKEKKMYAKMFAS